MKKTLWLPRTLLTVALSIYLPAILATDLSKLTAWTGDTPRLSLKDLGDKQHALTDYRGKVVVVNFWATWCGPCVKEMPSLAKLADKFSRDQFALITVNFGEGPKRIQSFLKKNDLDMTVLVDADMSASNAWVKKGLPTTFIIDADQNIRYQVLGDLAWDAPEVEALIRKLLPRA